MTNERAKELLNEVIDYISVANNSNDTIKILFNCGFTPDELIDEFGWSLSDVREAECDNLSDELWSLQMIIDRGEELTEEEEKRYVWIVDYLKGKDIEIPFGIEI